MGFFLKGEAKGFTLIELATGIFIAGVLSLSIYQVTTHLSRSTTYSALGDGTRTIRSRIETALRNDDSWNQILAKNPSLSCATGSNNPCTNFSAQRLVIVDALGAVLADVYPQNAPSSGQSFNFQGQKCSAVNGFDDPQDKSCLLRLDIVWAPICPPNTKTGQAAKSCFNPTVKINGSFSLNTSKIQNQAISFNTKNSDFEVLKLQSRSFS